jgi:DNA replication protein DnaC
MMGREVDQEILAANERLLKKRAELKATATHTPSTLRADNEIVKILENIRDNAKKIVDSQEKPDWLNDERWEEEKGDYLRGFEVEDAEYNEKRAMQELYHFGVPKRYEKSSFENFIGNDKIRKVCQEFALTDSDILITGATGCGKTHLSVAILRNIIERGIVEYPMQRTPSGKILCNPGVLGERQHARFVTVPRLLLEFRAVFSGTVKTDWNYDEDVRIKTEEDVIKEHLQLKILVLDDLGAEKTTDYSLTSLYMVIDGRINNMKRTIVTTNLSLEELEEKMDARVASRLSGMKVIKINMPDYRKKREAKQ